MILVQPVSLANNPNRAPVLRNFSEGSRGSGTTYWRSEGIAGPRRRVLERVRMPAVSMQMKGACPEAATK